jgi:hypothetical protein
LGGANSAGETANCGVKLDTVQYIKVQNGTALVFSTKINKSMNIPSQITGNDV